MLDSSFFEAAAKDLRSLANQVEQVRPISSKEILLSFSDVRHSYPKEQLKEFITWSKSDSASAFIYTFTVSQEASIESLHTAYKAAKDKKLDNRAYARLHQPSSVLYVGSSQSLESRIKQHFGYATKSIFAMQLCHWLPDRHDKINIKAYSFGKDIQQCVLQTIEDELWNRLKPMLGRQGAR
jgi:hypothetical protein